MPRITDKLVKELVPPVSGNKITYDEDITGFGVRITAKSAKSFIINYTIHRRERRFTIGEYPAWSVAAARAEATELRKQIDKGIDPLQQRTEEREAPTMRELWQRYEQQHLPTKAARSQADDRSMWLNYILPIIGEHTKIADVTANHVDNLHSGIRSTKPVRANRVIEVLRKAFNLAIRWQMRADNPCNGIAWAPEVGRERFLTKAELKRLSDAMDQHSNQVACDAIRLLLFTGARKNEVLKATWSMFNLDEGIWTKPSHHTKQRRTHRIPLSAAAISLLKAIRAEAENGAHHIYTHDYVFPNGEGKPLDDVKKVWWELRETAGLPDVRVHDLRHTYASILVSGGASLPVIGALLGHTQSQTTQRYAHLHHDPLRQATEFMSTALTHKHERAQTHPEIPDDSPTVTGKPDRTTT